MNTGKFNSVFFAALTTAIIASGCAESKQAKPPAAPARIAREVSFEKIRVTDKFYSEGAAFGDFNHDGKMDLTAGPNWYEGPKFVKQHAFAADDALDPHKYSKYFFSFSGDFNGDGWADIFVVGFPGADASWFENPKGSERAWARHLVLDVVDNESPVLADVDGDGKGELVCMNGERLGYAKARADANAPWVFHAVSDKKGFQRFTHGLGVGDVNGDGRVDFLEHTGWWEQPPSLAGDPKWVKHEADFGEGGAQMFAYDVDGDGLNDVITSIQAHGYGLAWFKQLPDGKFEKHLIMGVKPEEVPNGVRFSQPHALALADVDGDGLKDIITGKRFWAHGPDHDPEPNAPAVLYWFKLVRDAGKAEFVPHQIDDDSGVGTQCTAADVTGDGKIDVVIGNKKGTFVFVQKGK